MQCIANQFVEQLLVNSLGLIDAWKDDVGINSTVNFLSAYTGGLAVPNYGEFVKAITSSVEHTLKGSLDTTFDFDT